MDLKEAIAHLDEVLSDDDKWNGCEECKQEHIQLKKWLEELARWRTSVVNEKIKNPFAQTSTLICHNCDHKDEYIEELEYEQVDSIQKAVEVLRAELLMHGELYNGFLASILSPIKEFKTSIDDNELAENILKCIIGED